MKRKTDRFTVFLLTFSILTALILPLSAVLPSASDLTIYEKIIRLHVLANSDSDADQALKLRVRDGILETVAEIVGDITDRDAAEAALREQLDKIESAAADVLRREGSDYSVSVTLTKEAYPTREYENYTLPAGTYTSLRVLIGEAEGHNWWCVLFPQLCIGMQDAPDVTVIAEPDALIEAGLTPSQIRIITGDSAGVKIKFRLIELLAAIFS